MITITDPARNDHFQAAIIRAHLRLLMVGMRHSRLSGTSVLKAATRLTGTKYKRGQYQTALDDIQTLLDNINADLAEV